MKSDATQPCGMSPTKRGCRGSRPTTSAHWFHASGTATGEEECEQLLRALAPAEAHERADVAQLVGRVVAPMPCGRRAGRRIRASSARRSTSQPAGGQSAWRSPPGASAIVRRRRIEVAESADAGQVVDARARRWLAAIDAARSCRNSSRCAADRVRRCGVAERRRDLDRARRSPRAPRSRPSTSAPAWPNSPRG